MTKVVKAEEKKKKEWNAEKKRGERHEKVIEKRNGRQSYSEDEQERNGTRKDRTEHKGNPKRRNGKRRQRKKGVPPPGQSWHPWVCLTVGFIKHFAEVIWTPSPPGDNGGRRVIAAPNLIFGVMLWAPPLPALEWACAGILSLDPLPRIRDLGFLVWILCLEDVCILCPGPWFAFSLLRRFCFDPCLGSCASILSFGSFWSLFSSFRSFVALILWIKSFVYIPDADALPRHSAIFFVWVLCRRKWHKILFAKIRRWDP